MEINPNNLKLLQYAIEHAKNNTVDIASSIRKASFGERPDGQIESLRAELDLIDKWQKEYNEMHNENLFRLKAKKK